MTMDHESKRCVTFIVALAAILLSTSYGCSSSSPAPSSPTPTALADTPPSATWSCFTAAGTLFSSGACGATHAIAPQSFRTAATAPPFAPGGLTQSVTDSTVTLRWTAGASIGGDPVTSFIVEAGSTSGASDITDNFDTGSSQPVFIVTGVGAGTYFVRVRARSASGISAPSNEVIVVVAPLSGTCSGLPGAPSGLTSSVSGSTVSLMWTVPTGSCVQTTYIIEAGSVP